MATTENTEAMRRARRADSERKRRLVLAVTDAQLEAGRHSTIASIARQAGVGRKFIYDHPDLKRRASSSKPLRRPGGRPATSSPRPG